MKSNSSQKLKTSVFSLTSLIKKLKIMSKNSNYISTNRSKHYLKCHLIFVCKYRKKLLVGQLKDDMKQTLLNIANKSDFE